MAKHDIYNDATPSHPTAKKPRPSIGELRAAIAASGQAASYPTAQLETATRNDLIRICKAHAISVSVNAVPTL